MRSGSMSFLIMFWRWFFFSYLVKSMRMSAFPLWISVKVSGVTSLQIFSASRKIRRTFSSPICQGNRTILQETNAGVKYKHTGCIVAERDHRHRMPRSNLISAVISSAGRCAVSDAQRLANKTLHHGLLLFLFDKTTQCDEWGKKEKRNLLILATGHTTFQKLYSIG